MLDPLVQTELQALLQHPTETTETINDPVEVTLDELFEPVLWKSTTEILGSKLLSNTPQLNEEVTVGGDGKTADSPHIGPSSL
jgi:hypothetical protein